MKQPKIWPSAVWPEEYYFRPISMYLEAEIYLKLKRDVQRENEREIYRDYQQS